MKKLLCLLLALLMVFTIAACGDNSGSGDDKDNNGDGIHQDGNEGGENADQTTPSEPSAEGLGPWIVTEEVNYLGGIYRYHYDENGELSSYELYSASNEKRRDYKLTHSVTEEGGKLTVVDSKHVDDSEYAKDREMEYDAAGNLIRISEYALNEVTSDHLYTYDADGNLLFYEQVRHEQVVAQASYTYVDGKLATAAGKIFSGDDTYHYNYSYTYGDNGYLGEIRFDRSDVGEGTITLGKDVSRTEGGLHVLTHSAHSMAYQNLFSYEAELDADGQHSRFTLRFLRWGFQPDFALPLPAYGSMLSSWSECVGQITYTRLDVYLAELQAE